MKVLLVEDEERMAQALSELLRLEHYEVSSFADGTRGADALLTGLYDCAVLDVMLPGKDGFAICREARKAGIQTPVLMLTAKAELTDKVEGLDCGADDYLTKPFQTAELLARLRALCRRPALSPAFRSAGSGFGALAYADLELNPSTAELICTVTGQRVRLPEKEYHLIEYLLRNSGQILTREQLAERIWAARTKQNTTM